MDVDTSKKKKQRSIAVFCCYAYEDEELLNKLKGHLSPLQHQGLITVWYDRNISTGAVWEEEIKRHLSEAQIILLLISLDFMSSPYCYGIEMQRALERQKNGEATVIPVILRPAYWHEGLLSTLQALPTDGMPMTSKKWDSQDQAFYTIVVGVRSAVEIRIAKEEQLRKDEEARQARLAEEAEQIRRMEEEKQRRIKEERVRQAEEERRRLAKEAEQIRRVEEDRLRKNEEERVPQTERKQARQVEAHASTAKAPQLQASTQPKTSATSFEQVTPSSQAPSPQQVAPQLPPMHPRPASVSPEPGPSPRAQGVRGQ